MLAANQAYLRLYGFSAPQVIGHSFAIIFPENQRPQAIKSYKTVFAADPDTPPVSGQHVAADSTPYFESTIRRPGGEVRIVESRIEYIYENGRRAAMLSVIRDITEQRQTKTALDLSEARQRLLMEIMPAASARL